MPRNRACSPLEGFDGVGWHVWDPWNVTNRSDARYAL